MKKMIITMAVVSLAVLAQAATVSWKSGKVCAPTDENGTIGTVVANPTQMYIITLTAAQYNTYEGMSYADASAAIWDAFGGDNLPNTASATVKNAFGATYQQTVADASGLNYAAAIFTYTDASDQQWYIANIGKAEVSGSVGVSVGNLGTTFGGTVGGDITTWAAVPEPTSGLLLLLGMAGLALRRRRA